MSTVAFFNNKGGVGKTSLAYHTAWMAAEGGTRVLAVDLDPQANLSSMFLPDETLEALWAGQPSRTIDGALSPLFDRRGDLGSPHVEQIGPNLGLLVGDLSLSRYEDELSINWPRCADRVEAAFRVVAAFARLIDEAARRFDAQLTVVDVGPNLGAINRSALIACDAVVIPLGPDLFSLQGLRNMGPQIRRWRTEWSERRQRMPRTDFFLPEGRMEPIGYVLGRHTVRLDRPVKAFARWIDRMPGEYRRSILGESSEGAPPVGEDPHCLAQLKDYRSLMPFAQERHKPMFLLRPGDGAIGGHQAAVQECYRDFQRLTEQIAKRSHLGAVPV